MNRKIKFLTNFYIFVIIISVFLVGFVPKTSLTISGGQSYSPYYKGSENSSSVALTFNVYENSKVVKGILQVLKEKGVKATFFVGGCWADDNGEILNEIIADGHELGNHGYFHKNHKKLSYDGNFREIDDNTKIVLALTGYKMRLFAPPSGEYSQTTLKVAESLGYKTIMWSKDTIDWRDSDLQTIINRATNGVKGGDIILMHPKEHTLKALSTIIDTIKQNNLSLDIISKVCNIESQEL